MNLAVLVLLAAVHIGQCLLSVDSAKTSTSIPHGDVSGGSGAPLDSNIIRDIITQETALRIQLQKNVETLMKEFTTLKESTTNEITSLKQKTSSLNQEIADLRTENTKLRQSFDTLNSSCNQGCQNHGPPMAVSGDALSFVSDLKTQVRYLTLSLLDLQKQSSVLNDTLQDNFRNVSGNVNSGFKDVMVEILDVKEEQNKIKSSLVNLDSSHQQVTSSLRDDLNMTIRDLKTALGRTERQQGDLMNSISMLERNTTSLIKSQLHKVGFTASMATSDTSTTSGRRLVFPKVTVNEGHGYNPSDGVFTAPVGGLFVFYSSLESYTTHSYICDMVLNGNVKVRLYTEANSHILYQPASNMAVLRLQKGDRIWMKMATGSPIYSDSLSISTFTGYLINI